jgi:alpha-ribazole phosphatase
MSRSRCGNKRIALHLTPDSALRFVIDPLSLTRIDRLENGWRVVAVNQR